MITAFSALFIHDYSRHFDLMQKNCPEWAKVFNLHGNFVISIICLIIAVTVTASLSFLIIFHLLLKRKNLTTYEYILMKRQRREIETGETSNKVDAEVTKIIPR
jgi:hypothetical protein